MSLRTCYKMKTLPGQFITIPDSILSAPGSERDFRQRTMSFDLLGIIPLNKRSLTFHTPGSIQGLSLEGTRPKTSQDESKATKVTQSTPERRVPVLGQTRQQTQLYMKTREKMLSDTRQAVVPIDGPTRHLAVSGRLSTGDLAVFDSKAANAVLLDAEMQLKSGYPTIATSSMVARRSHMSLPEDVESQPDMKFFAELVKPVKYKWKFQKEKLKTLEPSKHGFHQRSQSPTFRRLVSAQEKLQYLVTVGDSDEPSPAVASIETQVDMLPESVVHSSARYTKSEPNTTRIIKVESLPATGNSYPMGRFNFQPEVRTIEPVRREEPFVEEDEGEEDSYTCTPSPRILTPPPPPRKKHNKHAKRLHQEFKVDFKKLDSHSELHLFLPHIQDNSRTATPDFLNTNYNTGKHELPPIGDSPGQKSPEDEKNKSKKKQTKRKRRIRRESNRE